MKILYVKNLEVKNERERGLYQNPLDQKRARPRVYTKTLYTNNEREKDKIAVYPAGGLANLVTVGATQGA